MASLGKRSLPEPVEREPSGWERVDRAMSKAKSQLQLGNAEEDYQTIGLLCREILISLGQAVFDPDLHPTSDGIVAGKTDAGRMLEAYIGSCLAGASNKEVRAHTKASLALALNLQHRTAPRSWLLFA